MGRIYIGSTRMKLRWVAPPNWPTMPPNFTPPTGWKPDDSWPEPPPGWQFWQATGESDSWLQRHLVAVGGIAAAVLIGLAVIVLAVSGGNSKQTITGDMAIFKGTDFENPNFTSFGGTCDGTGGYNDLSSGASVTVTDPAGKVIATGSLGEGHPLKGLACQFKFTITDVPKEKIYGIQISHRGILNYTQAQVDDHQVHATIGD
jgi:hypothetical protein